MAIYSNPVSLDDFVQGEDVNINLTLKDTDSDTPTDLTGATIVSSLRKEYNTDVLITFLTTNTDLVNGQFNLSLTGAQTSVLPTYGKNRMTSFVFDVKITQNDGSIFTPVYGYLKMMRGVTV